MSRIGSGDPALWADAQRLWEQAGDRYQAAYARFRQAEALIASPGNAGEASDLLHDAHSVSVELSAGPFARTSRGSPAGQPPWMTVNRHQNRPRSPGSPRRTSYPLNYRRALAFAVAIQRATTEIKPPIRLRIGLHAGETLYQEDDLFGRHVVIAARVAALAGGGEILVTSLIRELAEGASGLRFGARREHSFKGLSGTHHVFPLYWNPES